MPKLTVLQTPALAAAAVALVCASAVGPISPLSAQEPQAPGGTGLIIGQVIDADTGRGIPHAPVALIAISSQPGTPGVGRAGGPSRPFAVVSDSQGRFFFGGLPAGSYVPQTEVQGYMAPTQFRTIVVNDGASANTKILLRRLSSILGRVVDDAGTPVVGITVRAFRRLATQGRPSTLLAAAQSRTNDRGEFRLVSLTPEEYLVCACTTDPIPFDRHLLTMLAARPVDLLAVAGRAMVSGADTVSIDAALRMLPPTFHPNSTLASQAERVRVLASEDRTNVDITITAAAGRRVSGRLVGAPSSVNAQMIRLRLDGDLPEAASITQIPPMLVQPDGRFDFANVPPGQYVLEVTFRPGSQGGGPTGAALGFVGSRGATMAPPPPAPQRGGGPMDPALDPLWAMERIVVSNRDITGLAVVLNRSLVVSGRVVFSGSAPQPAPQTLQRPILQMLSVETGPLLRAYQSVIQADGTFEMRGVLPGRYGLAASLPIAGWPTMRSITGPGGELTDRLLELEASDITNLVVTMTDAAPASVEVRVQPQPKDETEEVWVRVFSAERRFWPEPFAAPRRFRSGRATTTGVVTITGLPAGEYFVAVAGENTSDWLTRQTLEKSSGQAERIRIAESEKIVVEIRR